MEREETWDADEAVTALYTAHYRSLVRMSALLLRDVDAAEEVVQDAFVAMHGAWRRLRDPERALAYLRQTVVNRSRSALRRRRTAERYVPPVLPDAPSAEHGALGGLDTIDMIHALRSLPERQRETLVLRLLPGLRSIGVSARCCRSEAVLAA